MGERQPPASSAAFVMSQRTFVVVRIGFILFFATSVLLISFGVAAQVAAASRSFHDQLHVWGLSTSLWGRVALRIADSSHTTKSGTQFALDSVFSFANLGLALFLYLLKPRDAAAPLLAFALIGTAAVFNLQAHAVYEAQQATGAEVVMHDGFHAISALTYALAMVVFPDGRLVPRWRPAPRAILYVAAVGVMGLVTLAVRGAPRAVVLVMLFGIGVPAVGAAAQAYRYRRPASATDRQLSRLLLLGIGVAAAIGVWALLTGLQHAQQSPYPGREPFLHILPVQIYRVFQFALSIVPIALFGGIFRYRLFAVNTLVTRAFVYGALAGFVTAVYVGVVVGVGGLIGATGARSLPLSITATFVVAVTFDPAKTRLERLVNRLVYGHRATPYEVLSEFSERVADAAATEDLLVRMARVMAEGTGADRADVWLAVDDELRPAASWPTDAASIPAALPITGPQIPWINDVTTAVAVRHQGELFGALTVTKPANEELTATEERLMGDLGRQAGLALRNVRLTTELRARLEDLRASRQRIVAAGDAERRRLERNLHDGAQQELVAVKVQLAIAEDMADELEGDAAPLLELLSRLKVQTGEALENLRDLARGIYPPLLAAEGLRTALTAQARKSPIDITVEADGLRRYSQETEAAVYFCCLEAFQNAAKYAGDCTVVTRIDEFNGGLRFQVEDNGCGFDAAQVEAGLGGRNMADRVESLDGTVRVASTPGHGTKVTGWIPIPVPSTTTP